MFKRKTVFWIVRSENGCRPQLSTTEDTGDTERNLFSSVSSVVASFYTDRKTPLGWCQTAV